MPTPQGFNFAEEPVDPAAVSPTGEVRPPFRGSNTQTAHASWTGARAVVHTWAAKQSAYLQLLAAGGSLTDNEAAALLRWPLSSVCSTRNAVIERLETDGFDLQDWGEGKTTRRTRWRIKR